MYFEKISSYGYVQRTRSLSYLLKLEWGQLCRVLNEFDITYYLKEDQKDNPVKRNE